MSRQETDKAANVFKTGLGGLQSLILCKLLWASSSQPSCSVAYLALECFWTEYDVGNRSRDGWKRSIENRNRNVVRRALKAMQIKGLVECVGVTTSQSEGAVSEGYEDEAARMYAGRYLPKGYTRESGAWALTAQGLRVAQAEERGLSER